MNYIKLIEIADLIAECLVSESTTAGCIDTSVSETIGVYQREPFAPRECVGSESSYQTAKLRILIHWSDSPATAEAKAGEVAELFEALDEKETAEHIIKFADVKAVRSIGKDEKGICEYIVDADIIYTGRNEE